MNQVKIKVIGVGGGSGNAINHMINEDMTNVDFIVANTDNQALDNLSVPNKIQLGINILDGKSTLMDLNKGREAVRESIEEIKAILNGADIVILLVGLGGGTGTGAAPIIAKTAKDMGVLTVSIVTSPFKFEGRKRRRFAKEGLKVLKRESDSVIVIPIEELLSGVERNLGIKECFRMVDNVLAQAVGCISKVILSYGKNDINLDFVDIETVMSYRGLALMGIGDGSGTNAAYDAIQATIKSPLFDNISIDGAMGVLVHFYVHPDYPILKLSKAISIIEESTNEDASIVFGTTTDENMDIEEVKVTIIATGFEKNSKSVLYDESIVEDILNVPIFPRNDLKLDKVETINILWKGPFSFSDIKCTDTDTFLKKDIYTKNVQTDSYCEPTLYLVYNLIGIEWELLYIGATTGNFDIASAKEWDIGDGQDINTLLIYEGTLLNEQNISSLEKYIEIQKVEALLKNILLNPSSFSYTKIISKRMIFLRNFNIEKKLYPLLKSKYYWDGDNVYDIVERKDTKKS